VKKTRRRMVFSWTWRCDDCGKGGTVTLPAHIDGWSGATAVLKAHQRRSPQCRGGVRTVRVSRLKRQRRDLEAR
jgi:hypothetical protein